ncbi:MAG: YihA family ribosome biogenesis GTP-binding protein [Calditrichaeota bacterium]|nr:YihA family ribosome biogenesis GTP-binding protein [Calditrichota bacterium]
MLKEKDFSKVTFEKSATTREQSPSLILPEVAFAGRSNVGKSSLLNSIFQRKNLVKTSSTPGKTQLINYFNVNDQIYCVDLPGYGYAKIPKSQKAKWQKMIETYFLENKNLRRVYLLIDSRHNHMESDREMLSWLEHFGLNFSLILSKTDKIKKQDLQKRIAFYTNTYPNSHCIPFSIKDGTAVRNIRFQLLKDISG